MAAVRFLISDFRSSPKPLLSYLCQQPLNLDNHLYVIFVETTEFQGWVTQLDLDIYVRLTL